MKTNLSEVMTRAHSMTRATRAQFPSADYRVTLSESLRIVWADATAPTPRAEWESMSGAEQYDALIRMTRYAWERGQAECDRKGEYRPNMFDWVKTDDDFLAIAGGAWARMDALLAENETSDTPCTKLSSVLYNAVYRESRAIKRAEIRNASALKTRTDEDGTETEYIIDHASPCAERIAPPPEQYTITRAAVEDACADDIDRAIVRLLYIGYSQDAIALRVKLSQRAVSKRIQRIRKRYGAQNNG